MNKEYFRKENEDELDYVMRLISKKKEERVDDLDWSDICDLLGLDLNKDSLRKSQDTEFGGLAVYNKMKARILNDKLKETNLKVAKNGNIAKRALQLHLDKALIERNDTVESIARLDPEVPINKFHLIPEREHTVASLDAFINYVLNEINECED